MRTVSNLFLGGNRACFVVLINLFILFNLGEVGQCTIVNLSADFSSPQAVNLSALGVNGQLLWSEIRYGSKLLVDLYEDIGVTHTRFPGGTIANYYNWENGSFECYVPTDKEASQRITSFNSTLKKRKRSYSSEDFVDFLNQAKSQFSYVLNLTCADLASTARLLEYYKKMGVFFRYVELGNELYSPSYQWGIKDGEEYLERAKVFSIAVKETYPDARSGVVVSPNSFNGRNLPEEDGKLVKSSYARKLQFDMVASNAEFADALIIHIYSKTENQKRKGAGTYSAQEMYCNAVRYFNERIDGCLKYLDKLGAGKKVWITEWGVALNPRWSKNIDTEFENSIFHGLFMAQGLLYFVQTPQVELANFHNLDSLLSDPEGNGNPMRVIYTLISKVFQQASAFVPVTTDNGKQLAILKTGRNSIQSELNETKLVYASIVLSGKDRDKGWLLVVNSDDKSNEVLLSTITNSSDVKLTTVETVRALHDSPVNNTYRDLKWRHEKNILSGKNNSVLLSPFSFSVVGIDLVRSAENPGGAN